MPPPLSNNSRLRQLPITQYVSPPVARDILQWRASQGSITITFPAEPNISGADYSQLDRKIVEHSVLLAANALLARSATKVLPLRSAQLHTEVQQRYPAKNIYIRRSDRGQPIPSPLCCYTTQVMCSQQQEQQIFQAIAQQGGALPLDLSRRELVHGQILPKGQRDPHPANSMYLMEVHAPPYSLKPLHLLQVMKDWEGISQVLWVAYVEPDIDGHARIMDVAAGAPEYKPTITDHWHHIRSPCFLALVTGGHKYIKACQGPDRPGIVLKPAQHASLELRPFRVWVRRVYNWPA